VTDTIVAAALAARTVADVDALEETLRAAGFAAARDLGDLPSNWSAVSSSADPCALLWERATNMWDAIIEMLACARSEQPWQTPREAVAALTGVSKAPAEMDPRDRIRLAKLATVSLHDSDDPVNTPTISFRDLGLGLTPGEMPETILNLQKSNKIDKPWLHGVFGKGGSTVDQYADATVFVTRKQPELLAPEEPDMIGVAVVRLVDEANRGLPFFRYLVGAVRQVYAVPASSHPDFEPGTYVAHVNYRADKMGKQNWNNEESIYAFAETILPAPTLPYSLSDERTGDARARPEDRREASSLAGLFGRLGKGAGLLAKSSWTNIETGHGTVRLRWWLFEDKDRRRRRAAKGYVVLYTTNGQVHHSWDNQRLQALVPTLRRVGQRILVQIDCDALPLKSRVQLFDTFRTSIRHNDQAKALEAAVAEALSTDPDLQRAESDLVTESMKSSSAEVSAGLLRDLNKHIAVKTAGLAVTPATVDPPPSPPPPVPAEDLYDEPTTFTGPEAVKALVGKRSWAHFSANAVDGFVPDRGRIELVPEPGSPEYAPTVSDLRNGRLRLGLNVPADARVGVYNLDVFLIWETDNGPVELPWSIKVDVVADIRPRDPKPGTPKPDVAREGMVAFIWSHTAAHADEGWDDLTAGELMQIPGEALAKHSSVYKPLAGVASVPTIVLNSDFKDWSAYQGKVFPKLLDNGQHVRRDRYAVAVGSSLTVLYATERKLADSGTADRGEDPPMTPAQLRRAGAQIARAALALLPDLDKAIGDLDSPAPE
jgi:hypothetical protein